MIGLLWLLVPVALLLGVAIGTRQERGRWQRVRRIEEEEREVRRSKGGVRLKSVVVKR